VAPPRSFVLALLLGITGGSAHAADLAEIKSAFALLHRREPALRAGPFLGAPRSAAWAVRKADVALLEALNEYVENMRRSASWGRLAVTYFGEDALTLLGRAKEAPQNQ